MNALGSDECSSTSGCESGWTLYLDHHSSSNFNHHHENKDTIRSKNEQDSHSDGDEEDLSMLSDASSGPPHFPDHHYAQDFSSAPIKASKVVVVVVKRRNTKRQKLKENQHLIQDHDHDDDTASSPLFDFSMNNITVSDTNQQTSTESSTVDYSQGFSATYFEERSSLQGFLQENEAHNNNKWYGGKEIGII